MFAYIPARIGSKRIAKKNIKALGGKPVICHVIERLLASSDIQGIAVSTDSQEVIEIVSKYEKVVTLAPREPVLSNDDATFIDLIKFDLPRFCHYFNDDDVLFTLATSALVTTEHYTQAINAYLKQPSALVLSVTELQQPPRLALELMETGQLTPLDKAAYLKPTKDLRPAYVDSGNFYLFKHSLMKNKQMFLDLTPMIPYILPLETGIDVDTPNDWRNLEANYNKL